MLVSLKAASLFSDFRVHGSLNTFPRHTLTGQRSQACCGIVPSLGSDKEIIGFLLPVIEFLPSVLKIWLPATCVRGRKTKERIIMKR